MDNKDFRSLSQIDCKYFLAIEGEEFGCFWIKEILWNLRFFRGEKHAGENFCSGVG